MAGTIEMKPWGNFEGKEVKLFTLKNNNGQEVDVLNYGATIRAVRTPDKGGRISDVVLGFDDINGTDYKTLLNLINRIIFLNIY